MQGYGLERPREGAAYTKPPCIATVLAALGKWRDKDVTNPGSGMADGGCPGNPGRTRGAPRLDSADTSYRNLRPALTVSHPRYIFHLLPKAGGGSSPRHNEKQEVRSMGKRPTSKPDKEPAPLGWTVEFLDQPAEKEFDSLTPSLQARLVSIGDLIERVGLPQVGSPHVRRVQGKIWEMRAQDAQGWGRCLYCAVTGKKVTILLAFAKKTNKTPARYIQLAIERMKDL
jgi:phage-related protein